MKRTLGKTTDGLDVILDDNNTHVAYHLLETPGLIGLVIEALPSLETNGQDQVVVERDMGRVVGATNLVETSDQDEIIYAKRKGRDAYGRFVKNRDVIPTQYIVVVLRKTVDGYLLWTAMCGRLLPQDAYDKTLSGARRMPWYSTSVSYKKTQSKRLNTALYYHSVVD